MARGGKREGAGRPPMASTKVGAALKEAAQAFTDDALGTLAEIMKDKECPPAARVSAASAILDRGYGKPKQEVEAELAGVIGIRTIKRVIVRPGDPDS